MPDISMCTHKTCPLRQFCYRHAESGTVPDRFTQSWTVFHPRFEPLAAGVRGMRVVCDGYELKEPKP